ncbi:MAG: hypothetical protein ISR90_00225 [Candidatus Marinimicrobia bacterium]|nr:hypothetical protein [Candidatus Neomarinimicrobiota bacterium]MBL7022467.1 hypothetical protein [Candidatus Neomarinimicrobiota bacterium]MBL7108678.1 hypothetical protein [Candidatus Neomarinimicrobiota bacterium]
MEQESIKIRHDKCAPYWALALFIFGSIGLSTIWIDLGSFWKGYVLDMTGPAWNYILFRGLFTSYTNNVWIRFFTPKRTLTIFLLVCFGIETMQYLNIYDSTFDLWDLIAYVSILIPLFFIDLKVNKTK